MKKMIFYRLVFVIFLNIGIVYGGCFEQICWTDEKDLILKVAQDFENDYKNGLHGEFSKQPTNCDISKLAGITYAVAKLETNFGKGGGSGIYNNWYGIKKGTGKFQPKWQETWGTWHKHLKYPSPYLATYDFMYLMRYSYKCVLSKENIFKYVGRENYNYYNKLLSIVSSFDRNALKDINTQNTQQNDNQNIYFDIIDSYEDRNDDLYFNNKGLKISITKGLLGYTAIVVGDKIKIESKYSETAFDIYYQKCNEEKCNEIKQKIVNISKDVYKSENGIYYFQIINKNNKIWFFYNNSYIYYIKEFDKEQLSIFGDYIYF